MNSTAQSAYREPQTLRAPSLRFPSIARAGKQKSKFAPIDPDSAWKQLLARDAAAQFLYAVSTTGVFCRPGCSSRRPLRANVRFFRTADEASAAGFRPCKRCRPATAWSSPLDEIRAHIESNLDRAVPLTELARLVRLSPFTVQRLFKREMGVSPLQYQRALRATWLRGELRKGDSVTNAIYNTGFGAASRAYEGSQLGMTPTRFAQGGKGETIAYASASTPFGWIIIGATERGICWLSLAATKTAAEETLREEFPAATLRRDPSLSRYVALALATVDSATSLNKKSAPPQVTALQVPPPQVSELDLRGTVFQLRVWQALRQIPRGQTKTYSQLARELGNPNATRAVARACALNRVSVLVPCHRVVGANGSLTGYRWGVDRKRQLLEAERGPR